MDLTEVKTVLTAYTLRDLQTTNHLLQYFEGLHTPPEMIRQALSEVIRDSVRTHRTLNRRSQVRTVTPQLTCPECGKEISLTKADGLLVRACRACRWSTIVER